jgi:hypothetical protein
MFVVPVERNFEQAHPPRFGAFELAENATLQAAQSFGSAGEGRRGPRAAIYAGTSTQAISDLSRLYFRQSAMDKMDRDRPFANG